MTGPNAPEPSAIRFIGPGCLSAVSGAFGGGMIAVLVGKMVGWARGCTPPEGLPACDWHVYAGIGMLVGLVLLPFLVIRRIRQSDADARHSARG